MRKLAAIIMLILVLIPLGPMGIDGLSQLSGIAITWGQYDLQEDGAIVYGQGVKDGSLWEVWCAWKCGLPQIIVSRKVMEVL